MLVFASLNYQQRTFACEETLVEESLLNSFLIFAGIINNLELEMPDSISGIS